MSESPVTAPNLTDPGDETARRYAYQHAYGVILWIAAYRGDRDYTAIWCEQHEDFLAEITADQFDAYQVKTRTAELGYWSFSHEPLQVSIKRFVELDKRFPSKIRTFYFVSNAKCSESEKEGSEHLSPALVMPRFNQTPLCGWCEKSLEYLSKETALNREALLSVLKRTRISVGPGDDSITTVIISEHPSPLYLSSEVKLVPPRGSIMPINISID